MRKFDECLHEQAASFEEFQLDFEKPFDAIWNYESRKWLQFLVALGLRYRRLIEIMSKMYELGGLGSGKDPISFEAFADTAENQWHTFERHHQLSPDEIRLSLAGFAAGLK